MREEVYLQEAAKRPLSLVRLRTFYNKIQKYLRRAWTGKKWLPIIPGIRTN
jgi:hypothetical protein